jgi:hypothetical protein
MKKALITVPFFALLIYGVNSFAQPAPMSAEKPEPAVSMAAPSGPMASAKPVAPKPETKKESGWDKADRWIGRISNIIWPLFLLVLTIVGWTSKKDWAKNARLQKLVNMALDNYSIVEKASKVTKWKGDDKLAELFKRILLEMQAQGDKPMSAEEEALVKRKVADKALADKAEGKQ